MTSLRTVMLPMPESEGVWDQF